MSVPPPPPATAPARPEWEGLDPEAKRRRLLEIALDVFAKRGLGAPMPEVARAAGVGVGSLYRCYGSKQDLISAIVVERIGDVRRMIEAAHAEPDAAAALERLLRELAEW